jgi:hypothetical protein
MLMATKITPNVYQVNRQFYFKMVSNAAGSDGARVNVTRVVAGKGDGEIGTSDSTKRYASVRAVLSKYDATRIAVKVTYEVWEDSVKNTKKDNRDWLRMEHTFVYSVSDFVRNTATLKSNWELASTNPSGSEAYYQDYFKGKKHGTCPIVTGRDSLYAANRPKSWLPIANNNILVRIDGGGNELTSVGNLSIEGKISVNFTVNEQIITQVADKTIGTITSKDSSSKLNLTLTSADKAPKTFDTLPARIKEILGCGTVIYGSYGNTCSSVLDVNKLFEYGMLRRNSNPSFKGLSVMEEGANSYTKKIENSLEVKASASFMGVAFSSETKSTFSEERTEDSTFKFCKINKLYSFGEYSIDGCSMRQSLVDTSALPIRVLKFLSPRFLYDLNHESPEAILNTYGTHVLGGMIFGGRMEYTMSYKKMITTLSKTKTFSSNNTISYGSSKNEKNDKEAAKDNASATKANESKQATSTSLMDCLALAIKSGVPIKPIVEAIVAIETAAKAARKAETTGKAADEADAAKKTKTAEDKLSALSASVSVNYSSSETENIRNEFASTHIECRLCSGDIIEGGRIMTDPSLATTWENSLKQENNRGFAEYLPSTVIPIYKFIPNDPAISKITPKQMETVWAKHLAEQGIGDVYTMKIPRTIAQKFKTNPIKNKTTFSTNGDWDTDVDKGEAAGYKLSMELVNIDGGGAGVDVILIVNELRGDKTEITHHQLIPLLCPRDLAQIAINTDANVYQNPKLELQGTVTGTSAAAEVIDITQSARNRGFGSGWLDLNADTLKISVDGAGKDWDNIWVEGTFKVNIIGYKR